MPVPPEAEAPATQPDWALMSNGRLPDGGPAYIETPPDPYAPNAPLIAEPWNTVTATFFIVIALAFAWRIRGRLREFPFMAACLPILLAGGIGGTLFHGTRRSYYYFLLDVVPIQILGLAGAIYMAYRYFGRRRLWLLLPLLIFYIVSNQLLFRALGPINRQLSINLYYAMLAALVVTPIVLVLVRTRFRHGGWVVAGVISFAVAWFFRLFDQRSAGYFPMGSHWLWHTFGAISTALVIQFLLQGRRRQAGDEAVKTGRTQKSTKYTIRESRQR